MRRELARLADEIFDVLVIGGGIVGAAIARDAALRGLSVALIERNDFAHATSAHNSKLMHGGLRYLRNFEFGLVRQALRERSIWLRVAPHLVRPLPFLFPVARKRIGARAVLSAGLTLYDLLSYDRNLLDDPAQRLPAHTWLDARAALACEPRLDGLPLAGAFRFFDAQMYSPERLALECVLDAAENGAAAANHLAALSMLLRNGRVEGARVRTVDPDTIFDVRARLTIVAVGPWADVFLAGALGRRMQALRRSKGIHLLVPPLTRGHALMIAAEGGHFFVLPWRQATLIGTTDTEFRDDPDAVTPSRTDVENFLAFVNDHLPSARLAPADVQYAYAGLRPLVDDGARTTYAASRRAELIDHGRRDGVEALFSVIGGKWTTSRQLAQKVVDAVLKKLDRRAAACATATRCVPGGAIGRIADFAREPYVQSRELANRDHLARLYGARLPKLLEIAAERAGLSGPLSPSGDIGAQILFAVREEMAVTLEDVVMRRTGMGQAGDPGAAALDQAAAIMAQSCGWIEKRRRAEIHSVAAIFRGPESFP